MFSDTIRQLDEIHLAVRDLTKMRAFYLETLGFEEEFHDEGQMCGVKTPGAALVLTAADQESSGTSLVFSCEDVESSLAAVIEKGITITHPVYDGHWGARVGGFEDPEGNTIYLEQAIDR